MVSGLLRPSNVHHKMANYPARPIAIAFDETTAEDLISIGVTSVGHRRNRLDAIAALGTETPVAASPDAPLRADAERCQLTVMFCDLVGSTEDLREVLEPDHHRGDRDAELALNGMHAMSTAPELPPQRWGSGGG